MPEEPQPASAIQELTTEIVASYVRRNSVPLDQLASLILTTYEALRRLGQPAEAVLAPQIPAVPIRQSVQRNVVVCLDCGWRGRVLRRHLGAQHGLVPAQYRERWRLPADHPLTAPEYSERRASLAKQLGLGRGTRRRSTTRRTKR